MGDKRYRVGGTRGGQDQFKWEDIKSDVHRENYLGHSLLAPVGRWQRGKDLKWWNNKRGNEADAAKAQAEMEKARLKQLDEDLLNEALGLAPRKPRTQQSELSAADKKKLLEKGTTAEGEDADTERVSGLGAGPAKHHDHIPVLSLKERELERLKKQQERKEGGLADASLVTIVDYDKEQQERAAEAAAMAARKEGENTERKRKREEKRLKKKERKEKKKAKKLKKRERKRLKQAAESERSAASNSARHVHARTAHDRTRERTCRQYPSKDEVAPVGHDEVARDTADSRKRNRSRDLEERGTHRLEEGARRARSDSPHTRQGSRHQDSRRTLDERARMNPRWRGDARHLRQRAEPGSRNGSSFEDRRPTQSRRSRRSGSVEVHERRRKRSAVSTSTSSSSSSSNSASTSSNDGSSSSDSENDGRRKLRPTERVGNSRERERDMRHVEREHSRIAGRRETSPRRRRRARDIEHASEARTFRRGRDEGRSRETGERGRQKGSAHR